MQLSRWGDVAAAVLSLAGNLQKYADYVTSSTERVNRMHSMREPARTEDHGECSVVKRLEAKLRTAVVTARYKSLEEKLLPAEVYGESVFVNPVAPANRHLRYQYMHGLQLLFPTELYSYNTGSHAGTLW